ncbi:TetR/AcrR family transcriptional regulator [Streptomyces sp. 7-21]|uniref:TetR/AcrR family transcriptional regulator n=1 Tax=Streptomyces sp. 7-21 TaxID=2802283 RepID=UPI00191DE4A0|nr:TetR/AcrR family transcriptional regulator [Streptomyces sp. 7-21]MBL1067521.1 TetR/AcrR family transcriptional regulator C-terminal domain-containing protein [Streptomyces sp. 7-21]
MTTVHSGGGADPAKSLRLLWQGRQKPSRGPKPGLELDDIVTAAVALADREGIGALSMRKVAAEMGVGTMTLYRYVPGKSELLALMLDHVQAPDEAEEKALRELGPGQWRAALERIGESTFRLYLRHPWLVQVNQSRPLLGPNALRGFDTTLAVLAPLNLSDQDRISVVSMIDSLVTGMARTQILQQQAVQESGISDEEFWAAQETVLNTAAEPGDFPHVFALDDNSFDLSHEETMRFALARLLDGLEAFLAARRQRAGDSGAAED